VASAGMSKPPHLDRNQSYLARHHLVSSVAPRTQAGFSPAPHGKPRCDVQHTFGGLLAEYSRARSHRSKLPAAGRSTRSEASSGCAALEGICPLHQRAVHGVGFGCHQQGLRSRGLLAAPALRPDSCILAPRACERLRPSLSRPWPVSTRRLRHLGDGQGSSVFTYAKTNVPTT